MNPYKHILEYNGVPKELDDDPLGWKEFTRTYRRDDTYHGVLRSEGDTQRFGKTDPITDGGGYQFILDAYYDGGIGAEVTYKRKVLNPYTNDYDDDFVGVLELTPTSGFNYTDKYVEAKVMDSSKMQALKSNDTKNYDLSSMVATNGNTIEAFVNSPELTKFNELDVFLYAECTGGSISGSEFFEAPNIDETFGFDYLDSDPSINLIGDRLKANESPKTVLIYKNETDESLPVALILKGIYEFTMQFARATTSGTTRVEYESIVREVDDAGVDTGIQDILYTGFYLNETISETKVVTGNINFERDYVLAPGYGLELFVNGRVEISTINGADVTVTSNDQYSTLDLSETYNIPSVNVDTYLSHEVGARLLQLMTGETGTGNILYAELLGRIDSEFTTYASNGRLANIATIGGRSLRKFPDGKTKVNFKDWFKSLDTMGNIAMWYDKPNDIIRIEDKGEVYRNEEILDLGTIAAKDITTKPYEKSYYSNISSGTSEKGDYDELQGVYEYNIQTEHQVDRPVKSTLDMRTPYNIDTLSMLLCMRYGYNREGLTDKKQDEKTMMVEVDLSTAPISTIQNDELPVVLTGFRGIDKRYNGNYTPRTCLQNNFKWIGASLRFGSSKFISFVNNSKDLIIGRDRQNENDAIGALFDDVYYLAETYEFEAAIDYDVIKQIDSDPHGYISFNDEHDNNYKGYILSVEIQDYKKIANFTLIKYNER